MSQNDFGTIDPGTTSGSDLATLLGQFRDSVYTQHSGNTRPGYIQAGQLWLDTSGSIWIWKLYDGTDDIIVGYLDPANNKFSPSNVDQPANIVVSAVGVTLAIADNNLTYQFTSAVTVGIVDAATLPVGWHVEILASGGNVVIDPNGSQQINGATTLTITNGDSVRIMKVGSAFVAQLMPSATKLDKSSAGFLSGLRNKIINGDFSIWQRGTPVAQGPASAVYTADRWRVTTAAGISCSTSRVTPAPGLPVGKHYASFAFTGTGITGSNVRQRIEGVETLAGKTVTATFYIADTVAVAGVLTLQQVFGTGGSPSAPVPTFTVIPTITTGMTKVSLVINVPSIAGKTRGTNGDDYLEIIFDVTAANGHTLSIGRVSLVEGDATAEDDPFSARHTQQELALCERYFRLVRAGVLFVAPSAGNAEGSFVSFNPPMRVSPSVTIFGTAIQNINASSFIRDSITREGFRMWAQSAAGGSVAVQTIDQADAEL